MNFIKSNRNFAIDKEVGVFMRGLDFRRAFRVGMKFDIKKALRALFFE